jgi:hypothetical protein
MSEAVATPTRFSYAVDSGTGTGITQNGLLTIVSVAAIAYALATVVHEGAGHGGACVLTGCKPQLVTSMQFLGDESGLPATASRIIAAGGSVANVVAAAVALLVMRHRGKRQRDRGVRTTWYFCWLVASINLLQASGYLLYSGITGVGDWAAVVKGAGPVWLWRLLLSLAGGVAYYATARWSMRRLGAHLSRDVDERVTQANWYALTAYVTGGVLSVLAGLRDPGGMWLVVISGAAASLGGTSALAWGPQLLRDPRFAPNGDGELVVGSRWRWMIAGVVVALGFVLVLGRGVRLRG